MLGNEGAPARRHNRNNQKGKISIESQRWLKLQKSDFTFRICIAQITFKYCQKGIQKHILII